MQRYSLELGQWEHWIECTRTLLTHIDKRPATLIGDTLYWPTRNIYIIAFNNKTTTLSYLEWPHETDDILIRNLHIIQGHGGGIGLVFIRNFTLHMWSSGRSSTGDHEWTPHNNVNLATLLSLDTSFPYHGEHAAKLLCAFEDKDRVIVRVKEGVFQLDFSNMQCKKFYCASNISCTLIPYSVTPG